MEWRRVEGLGGMRGAASVGLVGDGVGDGFIGDDVKLSDLEAFKMEAGMVKWFVLSLRAALGRDSEMGLEDDQV